MIAFYICKNLSPERKIAFCVVSWHLEILKLMSIDDINNMESQERPDVRSCAEMIYQ